MESNLNYKNILITGGAGFIGSHLAAELLNYDCHIVILDNYSTGKLSNLEAVSKSYYVEMVKRDIRDLESIKPCFKGIDYVFHLAAITSVSYSMKNPQETEDVNVMGTINVLKCVLNNKVKNVINISSCAIYGDLYYNKASQPIKEEDTKIEYLMSPYASSKKVAERFCESYQRNYNLPTMCLRLFNVYGKGQSKETIISRFIKLAKAHKPLEIYGDGKATRDFVYVKDVVKAFILAAEKDVSGVYNIGNGKETTVKELAELINELTGNKAGMVYKSPRDGDIKRSWADISKAKSIGYKPEYDLEMGLRDILGQ